MKHIAIFASGKGSNAQKIQKHFRYHSEIKLSLIICNNPKAGIIDLAAEWKIPVLMITKDDQKNPERLLSELHKHRIDWIVLAGYLWLIPESLINEFQNRIINIHPALLPKYGGKGMYGMNVHEAVKQANEIETGITIHLIDKEFDKGEMVFQAKVLLNENDTPDSIAQKVHQLEHQHFANVIEQIINGK